MTVSPEYAKEQINALVGSIYPSQNPVYTGHNCYYCGAWVPSGVVHTCDSQYRYTYQPPAPPALGPHEITASWAEYVRQAVEGS